MDIKKQKGEDALIFVIFLEEKQLFDIQCFLDTHEEVD